MLVPLNRFEIKERALAFFQKRNADTESEGIRLGKAEGFRGPPKKGPNSWMSPAFVIFPESFVCGFFQAGALPFGERLLE